MPASATSAPLYKHSVAFADKDPHLQASRPSSLSSHGGGVAPPRHRYGGLRVVNLSSRVTSGKASRGDVAGPVVDVVQYIEHCNGEVVRVVCCCSACPPPASVTRGEPFFCRRCRRLAMLSSSSRPLPPGPLVFRTVCDFSINNNSLASGAAATSNHSLSAQLRGLNVLVSLQYTGHERKRAWLVLCTWSCWQRCAPSSACSSSCTSCTSCSSSFLPPHTLPVAGCQALPNALVVASAVFDAFRGEGQRYLEKMRTELWRESQLGNSETSPEAEPTAGVGVGVYHSGRAHGGRRFETRRTASQPEFVRQVSADSVPTPVAAAQVCT